MNALAGLDWATPWGGLLALVPLLLLALARRQRQQLRGWADAHLLPWAMTDRAGGARRGRGGLDTLAWLLLALAATGPRLPLDSPAGGQPRHELRLMAVLDVSASMAAQDISPSRLQRARLELRDLLPRLRGERMGLILYAGYAGLLLPPTDDTALLERALEQAGPDLIPRPGSRLDLALQLAADALGDTGSRAVLLVTDAGEEHLDEGRAPAVRAAVARLRAAGVPLFVLAIASPLGGPVPLAEGGVIERGGAPLISRPALAAFGQLTQLGGGRLAAASDGDGDWRALYDAGIATLPGEPPAPGAVRAWQPLHAWPLGLALLLFLLAHWPARAARAPAAPDAAAGTAARLALLASLLPGLLLPWPRDAAAAPAAGAAERAAWQAWQAGRWAEAQQHYARAGGWRGHMGAGAAAWRQQDHAAALRHFGAALLLAESATQQADALYNQGNAAYALGRWQVAVGSFQAVLARRPGDAAATANLALAQRRLEQARIQPGTARSDLRGRGGRRGEGIVDPDVDRGGPVQDFDTASTGPVPDASGDASGAQRDAAQRQARQQADDARRLQSGLAKMERLEPRPRVLLRGLMAQDAPPERASGAGQPW